MGGAEGGMGGGEEKLVRHGVIAQGGMGGLAAGAGEGHPSPGMHQKHYSGRAPLILVRGAAERPDVTGDYVWRVALGPTARAVRMPNAWRRATASVRFASSVGA